jgi:tetratricopeptide (TPR) repeat protein
MASRASSRARSTRHAVRLPTQRAFRSSAGFARTAALIFAAAVAVRLAHLWSMRNAPFFEVLLGDAQSYDAWARQIAAGDYVGHDVFYQAPLYAYFLGGLYSIHRGLVLVRLCQAVLGASACVLLGYATQNLFGRAAGLIAGLLLACYAPAVFFDGLVQKSVLDIFFLCLLLALLSGIISERHPGSTVSAVPAFSRWRWLSVGLALGALSLTRENALVFLPVVLAWIWLDLHPVGNSRLSLTAALIVGLAIVVLPVGFRNLIAGGEFHLTTAQAGPNFFIGNNEHADGSYVPLRAGRGSPEYERVDATELAARATGRVLLPGEVSAYWTDRALKYIAAHPVDWLALEGRKFRMLWNRAEIVDTESEESHEGYSLPLWLLGHVFHFGLLAPLACLGAWATWGERRRLWPLYALVGAYALSALAFYVVARYRLPLVPFLIIFAAVALGRGASFLMTRPPRHAVVGIVGLAAVTVFCNVPVVSADLMQAVTYQNLGAALQGAGRLEDAAAAYERALVLEPEYAPAHNNLASVLRQRGNTREAVRHYEYALRIRRDYEDASFNLANSLTDLGELPQAIARYQQLLRERPDNVDIHSNLAVALAGADRLDEAVEHFRTAVSLAPQSAKGHYNLGHSLLSQGGIQEAVDQLSRAIQIDPTDASAHYELGNAYLVQHRPGDAVDEFRAAVRLSPTSVEGHNNLGIAFGSLGRLDEAIDEFRAALRIDSGFSQAQANLNAALAGRQSVTERPRR